MSKWKVKIQNRSNDIPPKLEDFGLTEELRAEIKREWRRWIETSHNMTPEQLDRLPEYQEFKEKQRRLLDYERARNRPRELSGWEFEREVARLFRKIGGYTETTRGSGDGGVDIRLYFSGRMLVVQCKNHTAPVSPSVVRELYGVLLHEEADGAVLVATGGFSNAAKEFAEGKPITLLDSSDVFRMEKGIAPSFSFFDETSARNT